MRSEKVVQQELDKALEEYASAVARGDVEKETELSVKICNLQTEFDWVML